MVISKLADTLVQNVEKTGERVSGALFEPVIRLGVTGLARSGKTVFITSLIANLLDRGRMTGLAAAKEGRIAAAFLQPQPDDTVPRFSYETHRDALFASEPHWPESTRAISELRLSLRVRRSGRLGGWRSPRTLHLDIVDYPGEWLLDLALLENSFSEWSEGALSQLERHPAGEVYRSALAAADPEAKLNEVQARSLSESFTEYLHSRRKSGLHGCTPGRFLLPGDLAGSPAITFAPLRGGRGRRGSLWREFERRFEAYKNKVVKPFFRRHLARIDRQIVLVDVLGAMSRGPDATEDMRQAMAGILGVFRPGRNAFLSQIFRGKRVERILFAATKADHIHHTQHARLTAIIQALTREAQDRADYADARTEALAIAAIRATTEETHSQQGTNLGMVRGTLECGRQAAYYFGQLPEDPGELLRAARKGESGWPGMDYENMAHFAPAKVTLKPGDGPPHIRLDQAMQFLIGDRL